MSTELNQSQVDALERRFIIRGVYLDYIYTLFWGLSGLLLTPVLLRYLGQAGYGLWAVFGSIIGYFTLFDLGMSTASTKYTAEYRAINDQENLNRILSTVFLAFIILGVLLVLVSLGLSPFLPRLFAVPEDLVTAGSIAFIVMGATVALRFAGSTFENVIYGYQRMDVLKAFGIIQIVAITVLTMASLYLGFGLIGVAAAAFLSFLALAALYLVFVRISSPEVDIRPRLASIGIFKQIGPYSIRSFVLGLTARVRHQTDNIVIGVFLGAAMVAPFAAACTLLFKITYLSSVVPHTVFPRFSKLYAQGKVDELRTLFLKATRIALAIMIPLGIFLALGGHQLIGLWVGEQNFVGMDVLLVVIAMQFLHVAVVPAGLVLQGIGKNKEFTYSELISAGLKLLLSIILVRQLGVLGVVLGTVVAHLATSFWVVPLSACRHTKLPVRQYILSGILPPVLAGIPAGAITWVVVRELTIGNSFVDLGVKGLLVLAIYSGVYLASAATREERQMCLRLLKGIARA